ncbi:hypothetical protein CDAR_498201 [Caerostris darwini]|uniref:RNase H type-1 domain-containing protein n=1 Tax=Caerostris darwini TaxID=1538125 RepID=A0AAV4U001_9ARAC|nr:hypothetical protein CDAR_498201 [Caerostris darwini]
MDLFSHFCLRDNEEADFFAKSATLELMTEPHVLIFSEIITLRKFTTNKLWAIPTYSQLPLQKECGAALAFKGNREMLTAFPRFASGLIRCFCFNNKVKVTKSTPIAGRSVPPQSTFWTV